MDYKLENGNDGSKNLVMKIRIMTDWHNIQFNNGCEIKTQHITELMLHEYQYTHFINYKQSIIVLSTGEM